MECQQGLVHVAHMYSEITTRNPPSVPLLKTLDERRDSVPQPDPREGLLGRLLLKCLGVLGFFVGYFKSKHLTTR